MYKPDTNAIITKGLDPVNQAANYAANKTKEKTMRFKPIEQPSTSQGVSPETLNLVPGTSEFKAAKTNGLLRIPLFDTGGDVEGNEDDHQLAILQGGERVLTPEQAKESH